MGQSFPLSRLPLHRAFPNKSILEGRCDGLVAPSSPGISFIVPSPEMVCLYGRCNPSIAPSFFERSASAPSETHSSKTPRQGRCDGGWRAVVPSLTKISSQAGAIGQLLLPVSPSHVNDRAFPNLKRHSMAAALSSSLQDHKSQRQV